MVILLCHTAAFNEVIYADFYAKIIDWNFRLVDENSQILVVVYVSNLNFSFSFRFVDENCRILVIVIVFVTKINLFSSTKIFVFVVVDEKNTVTHVHGVVNKDRCSAWWREMVELHWQHWSTYHGKKAQKIGWVHSLGNGSRERYRHY